MAAPDMSVPLCKALVRDFLESRGLTDVLRVFDKEMVRMHACVRASHTPASTGPAAAANTDHRACHPPPSCCVQPPGTITFDTKQDLTQALRLSKLVKKNAEKGKLVDVICVNGRAPALS